MGLHGLTIEQAHQGLAGKKFSALELTESCLSAVAKKDAAVEAYLEVFSESAVQRAKEADKKIQQGTATELTGIPIAIKDNILVKGRRATGGSKILENYTATYNASVVDKLQEAGAIILGKTNLDEFAMGSSTETSAYKKTKNPWDTSRVPGGSSGGSAAAVAADMCLAALGSDTGGSIRQPASFCGVVGLKPTYGRVSRYGLMAMTSSLDQIGPLTKTVQDAAYVFQAIAGKDAHDATTYDASEGAFVQPATDIKGMTIGLPEEYFIEGMDQAVKKRVLEAVDEFKKLGAKIVNVSMPLTKYALAVYQLTVTSEVSSNLARYDGIRYGYSAIEEGNAEQNLIDAYQVSRSKGLGHEAIRRIIVGTYALSAGYYDKFYGQAQKLRVLIRREFENIFKKVDCLVTPTAPSIAFSLGEKFDDPLMMYLSDIYTVPANVGGACAISVPCGFVQDMPVGLQIIAKPFDENTLFRVANQYEQATAWHTKKPKVD